MTWGCHLHSRSGTLSGESVGTKVTCSLFRALLSACMHTCICLATDSLVYFCVVCWHEAADLSRLMSAIILTSFEESWICAQVMLTTRLCCWAPRYFAYPALSLVLLNFCFSVHPFLFCSHYLPLPSCFLPTLMAGYWREISFPLEALSASVSWVHKSQSQSEIMGPGSFVVGFNGTSIPFEVSRGTRRVQQEFCERNLCGKELITFLPLHQRQW